MSRILKIKTKKIKLNEFSFLPSLITAGNAILGFLSIVHTFNKHYHKAAFFIILALLFDFFDGKIARHFKITSEFGLQLDSLADVISFGVAPSILAYSWCLKQLDIFSIIITSVYVLSGIMRLARFNISNLSKDNNNKFSLGLTISLAAGSISSIILLNPASVDSKNFALLIGFWILFISFLMTSKIKFRTYKEISLKPKNLFILLLDIALIFSLVLFTYYTILLFIILHIFFNLFNAVKIQFSYEK